MTPAPAAAGVAPASEPDRALRPCVNCGAPLAEGAAWCLHCGAPVRPARERRRDWRVGIAIVLAVIAAAAVVFALAVHGTSPAPPARLPADSPAASATPTPAGPRGSASWPPGLDGWTVVLGQQSTRTAAQTAATAAAASGISDVGVLATGEHPEMRPTGVYDVFAGRYPTRQAAQAGAASLPAAVRSRAAVALVQRPGGP